MTNIYHIIVTKKNLPKIFSLGGRNDRPRGNRWFNTPGVIGLMNTENRKKKQLEKLKTFIPIKVSWFIRLILVT